MSHPTPLHSTVRSQFEAHDLPLWATIVRREEDCLLGVGLDRFIEIDKILNADSITSNRTILFHACITPIVPVEEINKLNILKKPIASGSLAMSSLLVVTIDEAITLSVSNNRNK